MKLSIIQAFILPIMSLNSIFPDKGFDAEFPGREKMTFLIMIDSQMQEKQALTLVKSIRKFGGEYSTSPVIIVLSDTSRTKGITLRNNADIILNLEMDEKLRNFPFSDKVYACALVEKLVTGKSDWLVWLNPDALVVAPPGEIVADQNAWASLRPVHIKNVGIGCTESIPEYWKKIYVQTNIDTNALWLIESFVDNKLLRPYFNSGCMAFRPEKEILTEWKRTYEALLHDERLYNYYSADQYGSFFFHQAVLSAVIISKAGKNQINILPPSYGYPLTLQSRDDFIRKIKSVEEMKIILCEDYKNLQYLSMGEQYYSWIEMNCRQ
jgi:hypothetical protein